MKIAALMVAAAALVTTASLAPAAGVSKNTPGHKMQLKGSVKGTTGASGYAPGQRMQARGTTRLRARLPERHLRQLGQRPRLVQRLTTD